MTGARAGWQTGHFAAACFIKHMADNEAKNDTPESGTHNNCERNADYFTPILHILPEWSCSRPTQRHHYSGRATVN